MDAQTAVERALPLFRTTEPNDWAALSGGLARAGLPGEMAGDVAALMPIAFGRELLDGMQIEFSPEYAVHTPGGEVRIAGQLADHPVFAAAAALASRMVERQEGGEDFVAVATWSAEFAAVNQALNAGSDVSDLVAGPPVITQASPAAAPVTPSAPAAERRPWWKVW
ncbi:MAG TPA: hypothetical protein VFJ16_06735 [Longimicrobium sp.]|nr:hypothetical protein [Longimicrobium sp.]